MFVPRYQTGFVGRRLELAHVRERLVDGALVSLVGPGGVGKTRLATEAVSGRRVAFFDLTAAHGADDAAQLLLQSLGARPHAGSASDAVDEAARSLADHAADVVVLDNLEQLDGASGMVERLRRAGPVRPWLVTSRVPLNHADEQIARIEPFPDGARDGTDLFLRVLAATAPAAVLDADPDRVAALVRALEGLPLAIELAAGRAGVLPLDVIERRLSDPLGLLVDPTRPEGKQSTLWRSVAWSVELLPPSARRVLAWSSIFAEGFDLEAAESVFGAGCGPDLASLQRLHLLRCDEGAGRWRPYVVVRNFAERLLQDSGDLGAATTAHAAWCWEQSKDVVLDDGMWTTWGRVGADVDLAIRRVEEGAEGELLELGMLLWTRWASVHAVRWRPEEIVASAARMAPRVVGRLTAVIHWRSAHALCVQSRFAEADALLIPVIEWAQAIGDAQMQIVALSHRADVAFLQHDFDRCDAFYAEAFAAAHDHGMVGLQAEIRVGPANVKLLAQGRYDEVLANLAQARGFSEAWMLDSREGLTRAEMGDWAGVDECLARLELTLDRLGGWVRVERAIVLCLSALVRDRLPAAAVTSATTDLSSSIDGRYFRAFGAAAAALEGDGRLVDGVVSERDDGTREQAWGRLLVELAGVAVGRVPSERRDQRDPVLAAASDALAVLRAHALGDLDVSEATVQLAALSPPCWLLHFARRVLVDRIEQLGRVLVGPEGAWFDHQGARRDIAGPQLRRLLQALADGSDRDVEALFAAGWPGERATAESAAGRVRAAVTRLRREGVPVRFSAGRGWSLG